MKLTLEALQANEGDCLLMHYERPGTRSVRVLIDGGPRTATVTAVEPISALVIDRAGFQRLMDEHPVVRHDLVSALTQRLRQRAPAPLD